MHTGDQQSLGDEERRRREESCPYSGNPCSAPHWHRCNTTLAGGQGAAPMKLGCYEDATQRYANSRHKAHDSDYRMVGGDLYVRGSGGYFVNSSSGKEPKDV